MQNSVKRQSYKSAPKTALILGAGYTARTFIPHLQARGYHITATRRSKPININGVTEIAFDNLAGGVLSNTLRTAFETADVILNSIPPFKPNENQSRSVITNPALADPALAVLAGLSPKRDSWIGYLSATSVYGDLAGDWANEDSPIAPSLRRGRARANAEIAWIDTGWPVHIFRLAGIYGPDRNPFDRLRAGTARAVVKEGHVVNRIYVDDICDALLKSIDRPNPQRIYNLADGNPAPPQDVLYYAANLIGASRPKTVSVDSPDITAIARTFYAETKRIDIKRAQLELDWHSKHSTYQAGLQAILNAKS